MNKIRKILFIFNFSIFCFKSFQLDNIDIN